MASRRPRKTQRGVNDMSDLLDAIKLIKTPPPTSIRKAAAAVHGIPFKSLSRNVKKFDEQVPDINALRLRREGLSTSGSPRMCDVEI